MGGGVERDQVGRRQIAGGIVQKHVFRARIGRADLAGRLAGVPVVHGGVEMQAGIGGGPGGLADLFPELARLQRLGDLLVGAVDQIPVAVGLDRAQKIVLQRYRVVGVLAGYREVGLRIPVGVVDREIDLLVALAGELDDALDHGVRDHGAARQFYFAAKGRVLFGIEAIVAGAFAVDAGLQDRLEMLLVELGASDESGDLLLLL